MTAREHVREADGAVAELRFGDLRVLGEPPGDLEGETERVGRSPRRDRDPRISVAPRRARAPRDPLRDQERREPALGCRSLTLGPQPARGVVEHVLRARRRLAEREHLREQRDHPGDAMRDAEIVVALGCIRRTRPGHVLGCRLPRHAAGCVDVQCVEVMNDQREACLRSGRILRRVVQPLEEVHAETDQPTDQIVRARPALDGERTDELAVDEGEHLGGAVRRDVREHPGIAREPPEQVERLVLAGDPLDQPIHRDAIALVGLGIVELARGVRPEQRDIGSVLWLDIDRRQRVADRTDRVARGHGEITRQKRSPRHRWHDNMATMSDGDPAGELIGRRLGEFVLRERIGEGGFGMVYRAEQPILEREAVIKIAQVRALAGDPAVQRFLSEARLASRLDHPFAAHVYAFGAEADGLLWIAMELVRGTPLDVMLTEQGPLPIERAVPFLCRLCEVVHTAHEQGIVHRDLKPANVMVVARAGSVFPKLLDLGIAVDLRAQQSGDGIENRRTAMGTPLYMAPEMWLDARKAGAPADIYALGALAYEVLTGKPPYTGRSVMEIAAAHARKPPPKLPEGFAEGLDDVIARAMAKRIPNRFTSALDLGEALRQSSGVSLESVNMPQLDELTRDELMMRAPQPIAEAIAVLAGARTPPQGREAVWLVARTCAQYVGLVALACHLRVAGKPGESAAPFLEQLSASGLDTASWWKLARELCRPFAAIPDAHPLPELIGLYYENRSPLRTAMEVLLGSSDPGPNSTPEELRRFLVGAVPALAGVLRSINFLQAYRLVVTTDGNAEDWMGVRRPARQPAVLSGSVRGEVLIADVHGTLVADLESVAQVGAPSVGAAPEAFWLDGPHRGGNGARFVALPGRLERSDPKGWSRLGIDDKKTDAAKLGDAPPYRGLMTFTESDAGMFFGREREVEHFVNRLRTMSLIAVVGPSGAGKSSFVRAGVLPALGDSWKSVVVRPGPTPLANLTARLAALDVALEPRQLLADPEALGSALRARARAERTHLLLVVDQFEELFTLCLDAAEHDAYATALVRAARTDDDSVRVVITLRDDFLVRAAQLAIFRERLAASLQLLTTPLAADLLRILVEPARRAGFEFEDAALPKEMVDEVAAQPAALALLSFTASQLWQFRDRQFRQLPRKAYKALGGVGGALAQHAETTLGEMTEAEQKIVREVFRHLVTGEGTRAVLSRDELLQVSGGDPAAPVLERLIHARLLVAMESASGESIEVVHEALLSAWPRVVRWRQEDAESARLRDQLRVAARQWNERARPRGLLWRGEVLTEYRLWRARYPGALTANEDQFGKASEADTLRGRRIRQIALGAVLVGLTVALVIFARLRSAAEDNRQKAEVARSEAVQSEAEVRKSLVENQIEQGRRALVEGRPIEALLFLDAALRIDPAAESPAMRFMIARALEPLDAEMANLRGHTGQLFDIAFSPDGMRLATAADDGSVRVWDVRGALQHALAVPKGPTFAQWTPDGALITAGADGIPRLWDAAGKPRGELTGNTQPINYLTLDAAGTHALAATTAGTARVWDLATKASIQLGDGKPTMVQATFAPRGDVVAIAETDGSSLGGAISLWSTTGVKQRVLAGHTKGVRIGVFDAAGKRLVTASWDGTARIFDVASGKSLHELRGHDQAVRDAAWSPDGTMIATGSLDGTARIWNADTGESLRVLRGHAAQISRLRFLADGMLLTASGDGTAKLWEPKRGQLLASYGHSGYLFQADVTRADRALATASWDGTAKVWDLQRRSARALIGKPTSTPFVPAPLLSSDGKFAVRHSDGGIEIWTLDDGSKRELPSTAVVVGRAIDTRGHGVFADKTGGITAFELATGTTKTWRSDQRELTAIAVAPSGDRIVTAGADGSLVAWSREGAQLGRGKLAIAATGLEWSPDGATLLASSIKPEGSTVDLVDPALRSRKSFTAGRAVFSPDGTLVVVANDAEIRIVGVDGSEHRTLAATSQVVDMAWTADGKRLLLGEADGSIEMWSVEGKREARVIGHDTYITAITLRDSLFVTAAGDSSVQVWDLAKLRPIYRLAAPGGTLAGAIDPTGTWLVTTDDVNIDVWRANRSRVTPAELREIARCRLPYRLDGQVIVPTKRPDDC